MLTAVSSLITTNEHIEIIFDGFLKEYDSFITSRLDPYNVEDIKTIPLTQEET